MVFSKSKELTVKITLQSGYFKKPFIFGEKVVLLLLHIILF